MATKINNNYTTTHEDYIEYTRTPDVWGNYGHILAFQKLYASPPNAKLDVIVWNKSPKALTKQEKENTTTIPAHLPTRANIWVMGVPRWNVTNPGLPTLHLKYMNSSTDQHCPQRAANIKENPANHYDIIQTIRPSQYTTLPDIQRQVDKHYKQHQPPSNDIPNEEIEEKIQHQHRTTGIENNTIKATPPQPK